MADEIENLSDDQFLELVDKVSSGLAGEGAATKSLMETLHRTLAARLITQLALPNCPAGVMAVANSMLKTNEIVVEADMEAVTVAKQRLAKTKNKLEVRRDEIVEQGKARTRGLPTPEELV